MVKVNLLPKEELDNKPIGKFLKWTLSYGRYIIISVELIVFLVFFSRFIYDQRLANIQERVEQKQAIVASASDFEQKIRNLQDTISQVKSLDNGRTVYLSVLERLKQIIPKDMIFTSIKFSHSNMVIDGETLSNESFARFITDLKASPEFFSEITVTSVGKNPAKQGVHITKDENTDVVTFSISSQIEGFNKVTPTPVVVTVTPASKEAVQIQ